MPPTRPSIPDSVSSSEIIAQGQLSLDINPTQTEAALSFIAQSDGETWTREKILSLLRKWEVLSFVNPVALEKALTALRRAGPDKVRVVVAEGVRPQPDPQAIRWEENPVPAELLITADNTIREAPVPRVFAWRYRKRRLEETRTKKHAIIAPRVVIEALKEERPFDPAVRRTGYAAAGALVATIGTAGEGTPGRTFRGDPLPAPPPGRPELLYGEGFTLRENKLYVQESGFLRYGADWVDVIPFAAADFSVTLAPDGSDVFLSFSPGPVNQLDTLVERILAETGRLGLKHEEIISSDSISVLVREAIEKKVPLEDRPLCRPVDAVCTVRVTEDRLHAYLTLKKGRGLGKPLTLGAVQTAITESLVTQINKAQVREDIRAYFRDPVIRELIEYELAQGTPPLDGEQGTLEWEITFSGQAEKMAVLARFAKMPEAEKTFPSLREFPLAAVKELALVAPEGKIARMTPPQRGRAGVDVYGRPLEGNAGKGIDIRAYEHVKKYGLYLVSEIQGYLEYGRREEAYCLRVRPHQDAQVTCEVSLDGMRAFLTIRPHRGYGEPVSSPKVYMALREERVTAGLKEKIIEQAVTTAQDGQLVEHLLVAEGRSPVHAEGARLVSKVNRPAEKHVRILTDGRADYKSVSNIPIVRVGDLVAEIIPPRTRAENGFDVYGKPLIARLRAESELPPLVNLRQVPGPAGLVHLYAEKEGEFVVTPSAAGVRQLHVIAGDVGLETGNIDFPGSVLVDGSVREGFRVFSKGAVTVNNLVEEAVISAEGDVVIQQGVKGRKQAVVRTRASIECLFAENASLLAVGDVRLERSALNCTIKCNGRLTIGRTKGTLMGGAARARNGMTLINLGSVGEAKTAVSFGQDYILGDRIEHEEKEIEKLKSRIHDIDRLMPNMSRVRSEDAAKLAALREEKLKLLKAVEERNVGLFNMREKFEEHTPGAVVVRGTVYPGVTIESHGRHYAIRSETSNVQYTFDPKSGTIEEKPIIYSLRRADRTFTGLGKTAKRTKKEEKNKKEKTK